MSVCPRGQAKSLLCGVNKSAVIDTDMPVHIDILAALNLLPEALILPIDGEDILPGDYKGVIPFTIACMATAR